MILKLKKKKIPILIAYIALELKLNKTRGSREALVACINISASPAIFINLTINKCKINNNMYAYAYMPKVGTNVGNNGLYMSS